ncbi:aminotransferase class I/II-fold pyridoxal phosphate-dependent enzyme [Isoptericola halotolerans]|uniref:DNA-binding transcriptional MocR family regulator n=1 Tax=Isoptericola halotolerans TaxID=300560 RepID=A0ABX2A1U7_9MICO|nr:aminotransferase class I/II-fold pyridoxal phosphate-dependent enzyme [Isoptericola halotolerans]NOV96769.1 DNA-binding transcriptional MocR family regulator [Isoptericola halotolerans]
MEPSYDAARIAAEVAERSPRGIAASLSRLVRSGALRTGDRLPTVRDLARELGVSPATVSGAFQAMSAVGLVTSRGRAGTSVLPAPRSWLPPRYRSMAADAGAPADQAGAAPGAPRVDLSSGTPDADLLPRLGPALARAAHHVPAADTSSYLESPVLPELETLTRETWPFSPQRVTVVDGALDAIGRTLEQVVGFGDRVAVEDPGFPPTFDLLDQLGLERVPLELDERGVRHRSLAAALGRGVRAVVLQPRAQNPTGRSLTPTRARELAGLLRRLGPGVAVIEDDHSGLISSARDVSLGSYLPDQVVHVRSYSKSHGPDLRIAAVGGPARVLDPLVARRMLGPGWTSRLLQRVLVDLLTDSTAVAAVEHARRMYFARQRGFVAALARQGLDVQAGDGVNLWLAVDDEATARTRLEAAGVRVAVGAPFRAGRAHAGRADGHLRLTVGMLRDDPGPVARAVALAVRP